MTDDETRETADQLIEVIHQRQRLTAITVLQALHQDAAELENGEVSAVLDKALVALREI